MIWLIIILAFLALVIIAGCIFGVSVNVKQEVSVTVGKKHLSWGKE